MLEKPSCDLTIGFPIVGMVASAGGLDGFKKFFSAMPADSGMAFVLIPHLDPTHESLMVGLLSNLTSMPVVEALQGMTVQINNVYIIPPNKFLAISDGQLQLSDPPAQRGWKTSIDFFLRSLAQDQTERAIGIVLSGTGNHGSSGIREIKMVGGLTMAQHPDTADYDQMPQNAIATGQVDCVLSPEEMPAKLIKYVEQPYVSSAGKGIASSVGSASMLNKILTFLHSQTKYDFRSYRKAMVQRRIQRRMGLLHINSLANYLKLLHHQPSESTALYKDLLISVTAFFRDPEAFQIMQQEVIPALIARHNDDSSIRVWVPGCATGEEVYSIAMLLLEGISAPSDRASAVSTGPDGEESKHGKEEGGQEISTQPSIQIFASDIDNDAIEFARAGIYPASALSNISPERLQRFFDEVDKDQYRINKQLRKTIVFSHQNLIGDAPFSNLDFISCRNLLIYLEPELQQKVISLFHFTLVSNGYLLLGPSETIGRTNDLFEAVSKKWRIFRKIKPLRRELIGIPLIKTDERRPLVSRNLSSGIHRKSLKELAERLVLNEFAPAAALINRKFEILYLTGPLVNYLEFPMGELSKDLLAMTRSGLRTKLRIICNNATRNGRKVVDTTARVKRNGIYVHCSITVRPLTEIPEAEGLMLVTFHDREPWQSDDTPAGATSDSNTATILQVDDTMLVQHLEYELKTLSEELHSSIEEMESSTEELKTSNEEIMSVNEELQSTNEELETSKEELQLLNEQLSMSNSQLQDKIVELDQATDDLINLMSSTEIATIFLDEALNIKRFTPPSTSVLHLRFSDVGRPLRDIAPKFLDDQMLNDCQQVLETLTPSEQEIQTDEDKYYLRRTLPYRTVDHHVGGVVITFVDLTRLRQAEIEQRESDAEFVAALREGNERMSAILDTAADAIITFDQQGKIDLVNRATETQFGFIRDELVGKPISLLIPTFEDSQKHDSLEVYLEHQQAQALGNVREAVARRSNGSLFPVEFAIGKVEHFGLFTVILRDISERKKLQAHILDIASEEQRRIGHELHDGTQQELTGLSLFAGTLSELLDTAVRSDIQDSQKWTLKKDSLVKLKQTAERLLTGINTAHQHVHQLSHGIMPVQIDAEGLHSALNDLAVTTNEAQRINCHFESSGTSYISNNLIATQLYRIVQESICNALQHGKADEIHILLSQQDEHIILEVRDNGIGFDPHEKYQRGTMERGMGKRIMEYRTSLLGGVLQFQRNTGPGMTIRCIVPTKEYLL